MSTWNRWVGGRIVPADGPVRDGEDWAKAFGRLGFHEMLSYGDPDGIGCDVWARSEGEGYIVSFHDCNRCYGVIAESYFDLLDLVARFAPALALGRLGLIDDKIEETRTTLRPDVSNWRERMK
jgi:hypothetical protein